MYVLIISNDKIACNVNVFITYLSVWKILISKEVVCVFLYAARTHAFLLCSSIANATANQSDARSTEPYGIKGSSFKRNIITPEEDGRGTAHTNKTDRVRIRKHLQHEYYIYVGD